MPILNNKVFINRRNRFYDALVLDSIFPIRARNIISKIFGFLSIFFIIIIFTGQFLPLLRQFVSQDTLSGMFLVFFSLWFSMRMIEWFYRSQIYKDEVKIESGKNFAKPQIGPSFPVSQIYYKTRQTDLLKSFVLSSYGEMIMARLGMGRDAMRTFLSNRNNKTDFSKYIDSLGEVRTLGALAGFIFEKDEVFRDFLFQFGIKKEDVAGSGSWIERNLKRERRVKRWWGRVRLGQIKGIGSDWAYGGAYVLGRYGREVSYSSVRTIERESEDYGSEEVAKIEMILSREKEANAILVGEDGIGKDSVVKNFAAKIAKGKMPYNLEGRKMISLDTKTLIASNKTKALFEKEVISVFNDIIKSGNIILVIENLPDFLAGAKTLGSDLPALLDHYLSSSNVQVVALSDTDRFHGEISTNGILMRRFEVVMMEEPEDSEVVIILEREAEILESKNKIFFTYQSIVAIATSAEHYLTEGVMPDKALDLIMEIVPEFSSLENPIVSRKDVLNFVQQKTNMPVGAISEGEREKLVNMESLLHERVVGQDEAVKFISNALKRARAGVRSMHKPIGSFLFMGPTGVGKTEVAKTLAEVFFGSEDSLSRLDMSEYQSEDGLGKLIGSFEGGKTGSMTKILKERPYGVLLLDELEKANSHVLDLFLQILDEGFFHDMDGKKVNARNIIFIATSNAASDLIRAAVKEGKNLSELKNKIVDDIINKKIFKPEFLNRFDGVVLFHPLEREHYGRIAVLMLNKLKERLRKEKSIDLVINKALIDMVIEKGSDPQFGARPMKRAIQEQVEQIVADKIIAGEVSRGSKIELSSDDLA